MNVVIEGAINCCHYSLLTELQIPIIPGPEFTGNFTNPGREHKIAVTRSDRVPLHTQAHPLKSPYNVVISQTQAYPLKSPTMFCSSRNALECVIAGLTIKNDNLLIIHQEKTRDVL